MVNLTETQLEFLEFSLEMKRSSLLSDITDQLELTDTQKKVLIKIYDIGFREGFICGTISDQVMNEPDV